jgi:AraC-like DNA-binding protein
MELPFKLFHFQTAVDVPMGLLSVGCHVQRYNYRPKGPLFSQIFLGQQGNGIFIINKNKKVTLRPGEVLIIRDSTPHEYYAIESDPWVVTFAAFFNHPSLWDVFGFDIENPFHIPSPERLNPMFESLWNLQVDQEEAPWEASKQLYTLFIEIKKQLTSQKKLPVFTSAQIVEQVKTFLKEHVSETISTEELAQSFGYSERHLNRLFVKSEGMTIQQVFRKIKIEFASKMLIERPHWNVTDIALMTGLDANYFSRLFKKQYGVTPKNYSQSRNAQTVNVFKKNQKNQVFT